MDHLACAAQDDTSICPLGLESDEIPNVFSGMEEIDADLLLLENQAALSHPSQTATFECIGSGVIQSELLFQAHSSGSYSVSMPDYQECGRSALPHVECSALPLDKTNLDVSHGTSWDPTWHQSINGIDPKLLYQPFGFKASIDSERAGLVLGLPQETCISSDFSRDADLKDCGDSKSLESPLEARSGHLEVLSTRGKNMTLPTKSLVGGELMFLDSQDSELSLRMQSDSHGQDSFLPQPPQQPPVAILKHTEIQSRPPKRKGGRSRISQEAKVILEHHFDSNPYPSSREVTIIAQLAELEPKTVKNWFNNSRSRKQKAVDVDELRGTEGGPSAMEISKSKPSSKLTIAELDAMSTMSKGSSMISIERYLAEPLAEDPALLEDIEATIAQNTSSALAVSTSQAQTLQDVIGSRSPSPHNVTSPTSFWSNPHSFLAVPGRRSRNNSLDTISDSFSSDFTSGGYGTGGSAGTAFSGASYAGSLTSSFGRAPRRGRKRWRYAPYSRKASPPGYDHAPYRRRETEPSTSKASTRLWYCTFCGKQFLSKYEWKRHETSVHLPQSNWVCCPYVDGPLPKCHFCSKEWPSEIHLGEHRYQECQSRPETERTFYRKDQLAQHIRRVHQMTHLGHTDRENIDITDLLAEWHRPAAALVSNDPALHCGFCGKLFLTLEERMEDVAAHFINGLDLTAWWPGRVNNEFEQCGQKLR